MPRVIVVLYDGAGLLPKPGLKDPLDGWRCTPDDLFRRPDDPLDGFHVLRSGIAISHTDTTRHCLPEHGPMLWVHARSSEICSPRKRKQADDIHPCPVSADGGVGPSVVPEVHDELLGLADILLLKGCCPRISVSWATSSLYSVLSSLLIRPITGVVCELDDLVADVYG